METHVKKVYMRKDLKMCSKCNCDQSQSSRRGWSMCLVCEKSFHNSCVGLTKKTSASLPKWTCDKCLNPVKTQVLVTKDSHLSQDDLRGKDEENDFIDHLVPYIGNTPSDQEGPKCYIDVIEVIQKTRILNRIPKGARVQAARALTNVIQDILDNNNVTSLLQLMVFSTCLRRPRTIDELSLTSKIKIQIQKYEDWKSRSKGMDYQSFLSSLVEMINDGDSTCLKDTNTRPNQNHTHTAGKKDSHIKVLVSKKINAFDIRGAARVAASQEKIASPTAENALLLKNLHPKGSLSISEADDLMELTNEDIISYKFEIKMVKDMIKTFNSGSAAGPDGLAPDILKDMTRGNSSNHNDLLEKITALVNQVIEGKVPENIRPLFFGANLIALSKPDGGIRPIAVGNTWRRLCSKLVAKKGTQAMSGTMAPRQLGCGVPRGAESIVHAARKYAVKGEILVKVDFKNAFNTLRRKVILETVKRDLPLAFKYTSSAYGSPSYLFTRGFQELGLNVLMSNEGVQQGDPMGSLLFCMSTMPVVNSLTCKFNAWYLDDGTLGGDLTQVATDLDCMMRKAGDIGLVLNGRKTEVLINQEISISKQNEIKTNLNKVVEDLYYPPVKDYNILGAPIVDNATDNALLEKIQDLEKFSNSLTLLDAHEALFLLKNCFAIPKLNHLLRCGGCFNNNILKDYDEILRKTLQNVINTTINNESWEQASLPSGLGGLGIRKATDIALPAYLASKYGSEELVENILKDCHPEGPDILFDSALDTWKNNGLDVPMILSSQKQWDMIMATRQADTVLERAPNPVQRARILASRMEHANDWVEALPVSKLGLKLGDSQLRITAALQIGSPICHPHRCICGGHTDSFGYHGLSCGRNAGRITRHTEANDIIKRALQSAGIPSQLEPTGLNRKDGKRPDGVTLSPWSEGRPAVWDFTCSDTVAPSHVNKTSLLAGAAAQEAEILKVAKYSNISDLYIMFPIAVETLGGWGKEGLKFLKTLGRRIAQTTGENRSTAFLLQRLSIAVKRGNATSICSCMPRGKDLDDLFVL